MPTSKHRKKPKKNPRRRADSWRREWIGGLAPTPFQIDDCDPPYRPVAVIWLEHPSGRIVGTTMHHPDETDGALAAALAAALRDEHPRRPHTIRVATAELAAEVAGVLGDQVPVAVEPTPEIATVRDRMVKAMSDPDRDGPADSYLGRGEIPFATVAAFFHAAAELHREAPWQVAEDDDILRLDIPALEVDGACVAIIGNLGESLGILIFASLEDYEAFSEAGMAAELSGGLPDLDLTWLGLDFARGADLPPRKRREISRHGWPVPAADAYPDLTRYGPGLTRLPLTARDLRIGAAAAAAVARFFHAHGEDFASGPTGPLAETLRLDDGFEVHLRLPYQGGDGDDDLVDRLAAFAAERFGRDWSRFARHFADLDDAAPLAVPWSLFDFEVDGATIAQWFRRECLGDLRPAEHDLLAVQDAAWLSIWEVAAVEPGASIDLVDLLSGETRTVTERTASQSLVVRDAILARITEQGGSSYLDGLHPRALAPADAAEVVRLARGRLRRKRAVPVDRLRDSTFGGYLIRKWEAQVAMAEHRAGVAPRFSNTDGDPLLLTTDRFRIEAGAESEVARRLAGLPGARPPADSEDDVHFLRATGAADPAEGDLVIGRGRIAGGHLVLETNSLRRADDLRARVEAACGELVRHRLRDHADPRSPKLAEALAARAGGNDESADLPPEVAAEMRRIECEYLDRHYATWPDHPLPALGGRTPREATRTANGRRELDVLLKAMENQERRLRGADGYDFAGLRRELGLE